MTPDNFLQKIMENTQEIKSEIEELSARITQVETLGQVIPAKLEAIEAKYSALDRQLEHSNGWFKATLTGNIAVFIGGAIGVVSICVQLAGVSGSVGRAEAAATTAKSTAESNRLSLEQQSSKLTTVQGAVANNATLIASGKADLTTSISNNFTSTNNEISAIKTINSGLVTTLADVKTAATSTSGQVDLLNQHLTSAIDSWSGMSESVIAILKNPTEAQYETIQKQLTANNWRKDKSGLTFIVDMDLNIENGPPHVMQVAVIRTIPENDAVIEGIITYGRTIQPDNLIEITAIPRSSKSQNELEDFIAEEGSRIVVSITLAQSRKP